MNQTEEELILNNKGLIYTVIKQMHLKSKTEDEFQDYYDAGLVGLIKGAKHFDSSLGYMPSTYLARCIKISICRHLQIKTQLRHINPCGSDISLNANLKIDEELELEDMIADKSVDIENEVLKRLESEKLLFAINHCLNDKQKRRVCKKFGLLGYREHTFKEIALSEKCNVQAIQSTVSISLKRLKNYLEKNNKEAFMLEPKNNYNKSTHQKNENTLSKVNDYLFAQLEALNDTSKDIEIEIKKAKAVSQLAQNITNNFNTCIKAAQLSNKISSSDKERVMNLIGLKDE